jgi:hypothetical protein
MNALSRIRRPLAGAALALCVLATATFGMPTAGAQAAPISALTVQAGGTEARISFTTAEPTTVTADHRPVAAIPGRLPAGQVLGGVFQAVPTPTPMGTTPVTIFDGIGTLHRNYTTTHDLKLTRLTSNTAYDVTVTAEAKSGQKVTAQTRFTTAKQRVRVTLNRIVVHDDGDWIGKGEPTWYWGVDWTRDRVTDCYPQSAGRCQKADLNEGTIRPGTAAGQRFAFVFAEENFQPGVNPKPQPGGEDYTSMPENFTVAVVAHESDPDFPFPHFELPLSFPGQSSVTWHAPQEKESAEQQITLPADTHGFRSTVYFTITLFHDNQSYPPNDGRVYSTSK